MASLGVSTCTWFHLNDIPKRKEPILVAIPICGTVIATPGRFDRNGKPIAIGCTEPALAWAYYPKPSFNRIRKPIDPKTGKTGKPLPKLEGDQP
jgi:hypothetical protein